MDLGVQILYNGPLGPNTSGGVQLLQSQIIVFGPGGPNTTIVNGPGGVHLWGGSIIFVTLPTLPHLPSLSLLPIFFYYPHYVFVCVFNFKPNLLFCIHPPLTLSLSLSLSLSEYLSVNRVVGRGASDAVSLIPDSAGYHLEVTQDARTQLKPHFDSHSDYNA